LERKSIVVQKRQRSLCREGDFRGGGNVLEGKADKGRHSAEKGHESRRSRYCRVAAFASKVTKNGAASRADKMDDGQRIIRSGGG